MPSGEKSKTQLVRGWRASPRTLVVNPRRVKGQSTPPQSKDGHKAGQSWWETLPRSGATEEAAKKFHPGSSVGTLAWHRH